MFRLKRMVTHDGKMASDVDFNKLMEDSKDEGAKTPPDAKSKKVKFAVRSKNKRYLLSNCGFSYLIAFPTFIRCNFLMLYKRFSDISPFRKCNPIPAL